MNTATLTETNTTSSLALRIWMRQTPPWEYTEEKLKDSWRNSVKAERICNEPYWRKLESTLSAAEKLELQSRQAAAFDELIELMKPFSMKFEAWQIEAWLEVASARPEGKPDFASMLDQLKNALGRQHGKSGAELVAACTAIQRAAPICERLCIPFQSLVQVKLPDHPVLAAAAAAVRSFRQMDMGLEKVATQKELREYFNRPANTRQNQVVFTGGHLDRHRARENANGINKFIIRLEGEYGNRLATFVRIKPAGAKTDDLEESNSAGSWFDSIKKQMIINEPYWRKLNQTLTAAQWQQQEAEIETACNNLQSALKTHGRMFLAAEIQAHLSNTGQNELISLTMAACETLRIPLQCVVEGKLAGPVSATVTAFRTMDLGLQPFEKPNEVVKYFAGKPAGTQAVMTKGPRSHKHASEGIKQRGAIVTLEGEYGNRVATLLKMFGGRLAQIQDWESTGRDLEDDRFLISKQKDQLKPGGPAVYVEGSYGTIIRQLKKYFGPGSCSVPKTADRKGWMVTLKRVTKDAESS